MENREISLINLIYEFKRKLAVILIVGLVVGVAMAGFAWYKGKSATATNQYGSVCGIRVNDDATESVTSSASAEKNKGIILSDYVLNAVCETYNAAHKDAEISTDVLKTSLYPISSDDGNMIKLYAVTDNQDKAQAINELAAEYAVSALSDEGIDAKLIQKTQNMGAVTVSASEDLGQVDRCRYSISSTAEVGFSIVSAVKKGVIGFILGIIIAYICVCVLYIVRGRVVYANEIEDAGIRLLGVLGKDEEANKYSWGKAVSSVLLDGKPVRNALLLSCGCDAEYDKVKSLWTNEGIELVRGDDILVNPVAKVKAKDVDTTVVVVKSDKIKLDELYKLGKELTEGANGIAGAILVK